MRPTTPQATQQYPQSITCANYHLQQQTHSESQKCSQKVCEVKRYKVPFSEVKRLLKHLHFMERCIQSFTSHFTLLIIYTLTLQIGVQYTSNRGATSVTSQHSGANITHFRHRTSVWTAMSETFQWQIDKTDVPVTRNGIYIHQRNITIQTNTSEKTLLNYLENFYQTLPKTFPELLRNCKPSINLLHIDHPTHPYLIVLQNVSSKQTRIHFANIFQQIIQSIPTSIGMFRTLQSIHW